MLPYTRLANAFRMLICLSILLLAPWQPAPAQASDSARVDIFTAPQAETSLPASLQPATTPHFTAIDAGWAHTCGLAPGGEVQCWGSNASGQLGDGTHTERDRPVGVTGLTSDWVAISAGSYHTCALDSGGGVKCWGANDFGQLGLGSTIPISIPVDVSGLDVGVTAVATGGYHTCALLSGGGVKCWGWNYFGQLGDNSNEDRHTPVDVDGLTSGVIAITAGGVYTCALLSGGKVQCWGGALGANSSVPVDVTGLASGVTAIAAGDTHACAITSGGGLKCWGSNDQGQLGDGTQTYRDTPVDVTGLSSGVTAVSAGGGIFGNHTCALVSGRVKCWGGNWAGELGDGTLADRSTPADVSGLTSGVTAVTAGAYHTCALDAGGALVCWGWNQYSQTGDSTQTRSMPVDTSGLAPGVMAISAGWAHTCALSSGGGVKCWGDNTYNQLGDGTYTRHSTAVDVVGLDAGVTAIATGGYHTCALLSGGGVQCWGDNRYGQLGDGTQINKSTPVDVVGLTSGVTAISSSGWFTCALLSNGGVKCWGSNYYYQLGNGTNDDSWTPVDVSGLTSGVSALSAGGVHGCVLLTSGGVKCWGWNFYGELGDGSYTDRSTPVDVAGLASGVTAIVAGDAHTCALVTGGGLKCWGSNEAGQVGDGSPDNRPTPVDVPGLSSGVTQVAGGGIHTCALVSGGRLKCWGRNSEGQLGDGTLANRSTPIDVSGMAGGVTAITAGGYHTCALVGAGRAKCWGLDDDGQLGNGRFVRPTPVMIGGSYLTANYLDGSPGSFFTITGWNFQPNVEETLSINHQVYSQTLAVNATSGFIFFLNTQGAAPNHYEISVGSGSSVTTSIILTDTAPMRPKEGGGQEFSVLPGIVSYHFIYLPLATK